jgi:translation initiation factor 3 subunit F
MQRETLDAGLTYRD